MVLEKTLENPLDCKETKTVHPKGNQLCILIGNTDAEAESPIFWPPDTKSWLIGKDPDAGKDWRWEEKGMTEDGMVGWPHRLTQHKFEQAPGDSEGQGSLACCNPWGCKELDSTEVNWTVLLCLLLWKHEGFLCGELFFIPILKWDIKQIGGWWGLGERGTGSNCLMGTEFLFQFSSVAQSGQTLCDPMNCSTLGLPVHHQLL